MKISYLYMATSMLACSLLLPCSTALADMKTTPVEGVAYNIETSFADNLKNLVGKKVSINIHGGGQYTGLVKAVNKSMLHLEKLEGKEFFDALISVEKISAIETRFLMPAR